MRYDLPKSLEVDGEEREIRSDFRPVLDIITALNDLELTEREKVEVLLDIMYVEPYMILNKGEAINKAMWFISGGDEPGEKKNSPKLMDWEQDFKLIVAPINRVLGYECREKDCLHWWTFLGAYMEIGECTFSTVCRIRSKQAKHQKLEKYEKDYLRENYDIVMLKAKFSEKDKEIIDEII